MTNAWFPRFDDFGGFTSYDSYSLCSLQSTQTGDLRIVRIDKFSSCCTGHEEVFILVEKVDKHNIQVKFYQENDKGKEIWKAYGQFTKCDVHHQYAIVFKTPPYNHEIDQVVDVWLQLERPSDGATSQPIRFQYTPIDRMRKMPKRQDITSTGEEGGSNTEGGFKILPRGNNLSNSTEGTAAGPSTSKVRQGAIGQAETMASAENSKALAMNVALSICQGVHGWAETSNIALLLQKLRHLLCLVNDNGDNALHSAIINEQEIPFHSILDTLCSHSDTAGVINEPNAQNLTPIHLAVLLNRMDFVNELLRRNADISTQNSDGDTPLHSAVKSNNIECVKIMLQSPSASAAAKKQNYQTGMTPLHIAVSNGNAEMVELLCNSNADLNIQDCTYGRTPLHIAVEKETRESLLCALQLLKSAKAKGVEDLSNIQNYRGDTPLHIAASQGLSRQCALLMHYGADPLIENHIRKETEDESDEQESEEKLPGQNIYDVVADDKILRLIKGNENDWDMALKDVLVGSSNESLCGSSEPNLYSDSGIDVNSSLLNSSTCNQL